MTDPITEPAVPPTVTPGKQTSEYAMARLSQIAGLVMVLVGYATAILGDLSNRFPGVHWIAVALIVVGGVKSLLSSLGYGQQRTSLKKAATLDDASKELLS